MQYFYNVYVCDTMLRQSMMIPMIQTIYLALMLLLTSFLYLI